MIICSSFNEIGEEGGVHIGKGLETLTQLEELTLDIGK